MNTTLLGTFGLSTLTIGLAFSPSPERTPAPQPLLGQTFEVAMDGTSFAFEGPTSPSGFPAKGTPFVISGYLYPDGVFDANGELSGVNADGSPQFPSQVIGTWICRGWHLQDGDAATGPVTATTQIFEFHQGGAAGAHTVVTDGIELADFDVPFTRTITGASGRMRDLDDRNATCQQVYVGGGVNLSGGFNTEFTFER